MGVLEDEFTDPEANLAAGRHLCFVKGNWDRGVPMLALGSDAALKAAAIKDLRGANSAEEQAGLKTPAQLPRTDSDSTVLPNKEGGYAPNASKRVRQ